MKKFVFLSAIFLGLTIFSFSFSQECDKAEEACKNLSHQECLKLLENCVKYYEGEIKNLSQQIEKKLGEKKSLLNEIEILKKKIAQLNAEIQKTKLLLNETNLQIKETEKAIEKLRERINFERERIGIVLRAMDEWEKKSLLEILLVENSLSDFFNHLTYLENLNLRIRGILGVIKNLKASMEEQRDVLEKEKERAESLLKMQTLQKAQNDAMKKEKDYLLSLTEKQYQEYKKEKEALEKRASEIRKRIFELVGVSKPPTFEEAYKIAKDMEKITGIRPAFLLAVLTQESNLGKNVGQCYLKDPKTGKGVRISTGAPVNNVMAPGPPYSQRNDVAIFIQITKELQRDPFLTPVSCPLSFGWGGAMGPAQFIPTTWARYRERLEKILQRTPDPWRIYDAFLAASLFLTDYGAGSKKREDERKAALIYFSGSSKNEQFSWYANSVLAIADQYERDIEILEKTLAKNSLGFFNNFIQISI